jgi:hypothetical protein
LVGSDGHSGDEAIQAFFLDSPHETFGLRVGDDGSERDERNDPRRLDTRRGHGVACDGDGACFMEQAKRSKTPSRAHFRSRQR